MGLAAPSRVQTERAGTTKCLGLNCGRRFRSPDVINTRFCNRCKHKKYRDDRLLVFRFSPADSGSVKLIH
jgi:hypothetical protein